MRMSGLFLSRRAVYPAWSVTRAWFFGKVYMCTAGGISTFSIQAIDLQCVRRGHKQSGTEGGRPEKYRCVIRSICDIRMDVYCM